jgi:hypothetical protein
MDGSLHPVERMRLLVQGGLGGRKGEVLEGDAKDLAKKVIQIIRDKRDHVRDR